MKNAIIGCCALACRKFEIAPAHIEAGSSAYGLYLFNIRPKNIQLLPVAVASRGPAILRAGNYLWELPTRQHRDELVPISDAALVERDQKLGMFLGLGRCQFVTA